MGDPLEGCAQWSNRTLAEKSIARLLPLLRSKRVFYRSMTRNRARGSYGHSYGSPTPGFAWRSFTWSRRLGLPRPRIVRRSQSDARSSSKTTGRANSWRQEPGLSSPDPAWGYRHCSRIARRSKFLEAQKGHDFCTAATRLFVDHSTDDKSKEAAVALRTALNSTPAQASGTGEMAVLSRAFEKTKPLVWILVGDKPSPLRSWTTAQPP